MMCRLKICEALTLPVLAISLSLLFASAEPQASTIMNIISGVSSSRRHHHQPGGVPHLRVAEPIRGVPCTSRLIQSLTASGVQPRRELVDFRIVVPDFYAYCYRDVSQQSGSSCGNESDSIGPACVRQCSSYPHTNYTCAATGCSPSQMDCRRTKWKQYTSAVYWVVHWFFRLIPKFYKWPIFQGNKQRTAAAGAPLHLSPSLSSNPLLPSIIRRTYAKRALIAAAIAAHGTYGGAPLSSYLSLFPLPFHTMDQAGEVGYAAATNYTITINIEKVANWDPTGTLPLIMAWGHGFCSKVPNDTGPVVLWPRQQPNGRWTVTSDSSTGGNRNACSFCDRTSDQCVKASKCDVSTNFECVPVYEEDYAICQKTNAQGNIRSGFCISRQCSTTLSDAHTISRASSASSSARGSHLWLPPGYQMPLPVAQTVPPAALSFVSHALWFWDELAAASQSCSTDNGGCGTDLCVVNRWRRRTECMSPRVHGFKAAPPGISLNGEAIATISNVDPRQCLKACSVRPQCVAAILEQDLTCSLLKTEGQVVASAYSQAYRKLRRL